MLVFVAGDRALAERVLIDRRQQRCVLARFNASCDEVTHTERPNSVMESVRLFKSLTREQRNTFVACFLGWALDALDFFLLTFVLTPIGNEFGRPIKQVAFGITF